MFNFCKALAIALWSTLHICNTSTPQIKGPHKVTCSSFHV